MSFILLFILSAVAHIGGGMDGMGLFLKELIYYGTMFYWILRAMRRSGKHAKNDSQRFFTVYYYSSSFQPCLLSTFYSAGLHT